MTLNHKQQKTARETVNICKQMAFLFTTVEPLTVDTSEIRTHYIEDTGLGPNCTKYVLWDTDTSLYRTLLVVPMVSRIPSLTVSVIQQVQEPSTI